MYDVREYDIAVIGAGVVGAAIARELSKYELSVAILDKESDASGGASKANSGIVHSGFDPKEGTLMAKLNAAANKMFDSLCAELSLHFERNGSLVMAFDDEQLEHIGKLYRRGIANGIPGLRLLSAEETLKKEPAANPEVKGALWAETAGIIDPMLFTISLVENAAMNGVECFFNFEVQSIAKEAGGYKIASPRGTVSAKYVINAAGVYADRIHNMVSEPAFSIAPSRGQYFVLDKAEAGIVSATLFPCPSKAGKGIIVAPTVHGNVILGPTAERIHDREDMATTEEMLEQVSAGVRLLVPKLSAWRNNIRIFAGLRAVSDIDDFIIGEAGGAANFIDVAGIKSPGLTAAPAIAEHVAALLAEKGLALNPKKSFDPTVRRRLLIDMTPEEQSELIKSNPLYGRVICRCENITEGDIVDAINRPAGATTMEGVKRRCRAGMGRCQGGFCGPKVQRILARELNKPLEQIMLDKQGSYILTGRTK